MAKFDVKTMWKQGLDERNRFLDEAQLIADLTIPSLEPKPAGMYSNFSSNSAAMGPRKMKRPKSNAGCSGVKGLSSTIIAANAPANVRFFRLNSDPALGISAQGKKAIETFFTTSEDKIDRFLAHSNFSAFQHGLMERLLVEGTNVVKCDERNGFMLYPLRQIQVQRKWGKVCRILLEEMFYENDADGKICKKLQYILIDKETRAVYVQKDTDDFAKVNSAENSDAYIVCTTEIPTIDSYGRSYYADHYGLLAGIDDAAVAMYEAQKICSWNWASYDGPSTMPVARIAAIKPMEIIRIKHDSIRWQGANQKISDWQLVDNRLTMLENKFLSLSAIGLYQRASAAQTATEVIAIKNELDTLVGSPSQIVSQTVYHAIIDSLLDVLGIRKEFADIIAANLPDRNNIPKEILNSKLIDVIPTTGAPALAREQDLSRLYDSLKALASIIGPQGVLSVLNVPSLMKETFDGLRVNTVDLLKTQEQVNVEQAAMQPQAPLPEDAQSPEMVQKILAMRNQTPSQGRSNG